MRVKNTHSTVTVENKVHVDTNIVLQRARISPPGLPSTLEKHCMQPLYFTDRAS
jgi:hypothetical protein